MTDASSVTQCPHCKTAFHIGLAQLDAAGGRVRCGSCLEIFNAKEHFVVEQTHLFDNKNLSEQPGSQGLPENAEGASPEDNDEGPIILGGYDPTAVTSISREDVKRAAQVENDTDNTDESQPDGSSIIADLDGPVVELDDPLDEDEREALLQDALASVDALDEEGAIEEWESLDDANFLESAKSGKDRTERKSSDSVLIDDETPLDILQAEISDSNEPAQEEGADNLDDHSEQKRQWEDPDVDEGIAAETPIHGDIEGSVYAEKSGQETDPEQEPEIVAELSEEIESEIDSGEEELGGGSWQAETDKETAEPEPASLEPTSSIADEDYDDDPDLEDQPSPDFFIDSETQRKRRFTKSHWGWNLAAACLALVLVGELLFFQPTTLKKQPWFQSLSQMLCGALPCSTEPYLDIDQIELRTDMGINTNLNNVLSAYIELRNEAEVEQGFPKIAIYFMDIRGRTTASRIFTPEEYLRGEARSIGVIPTNRPVQIEIDIVDPGDDSISHEFRLFP